MWHAVMRAPWRFLFGAWPWRALGYLSASVAIGLLLLPIAILTLLFLPLWGIVIGALERRRTRLLGFPAQPSGHVPLRRDQRHIWLSVRMNEGATWRETVALLVDLVVGWLVLAVLFFQGLLLVLLVYVAVSGVRGPTRLNLFGDVWIVATPHTWLLLVPIAALSLCVFAYANAVLAAGQATLLRSLCGPRLHEMTRNVERLVQSRAALVEAFEAERRPHRTRPARWRPARARDARRAPRHGESRTRRPRRDGFGHCPGPRCAPTPPRDRRSTRWRRCGTPCAASTLPFLIDHGLRAALDELADRAPIPLRLEISDLGRLPAPVETAAYYFVTEAISNAAKHTVATRLTVRAGVRARRPRACSPPTTDRAERMRMAERACEDSPNAPPPSVVGSRSTARTAGRRRST